MEGGPPSRSPVCKKTCYYPCRISRKSLIPSRRNESRGALGAAELAYYLLSCRAPDDELRFDVVFAPHLALFFQLRKQARPALSRLVRCAIDGLWSVRAV